jgi:hypothetical protein
MTAAVVAPEFAAQAVMGLRIVAVGTVAPSSALEVPEAAAVRAAARAIVEEAAASSFGLLQD